MAKEVRRRSNCPISFALDIFGDKWTLLIIRDMMFSGKQTYSDFLSSDEKISTNILADRLTMLEYNGLIRSETDETKKTRKIYKLTQKSVDLLPILIEIVQWSASYDSKTGAPKEFIERIHNDKIGLIADLTSFLKKSNDLD